MDQSAKKLASIFNLSEYEAKLYISALDMSEATISDLASRAGIPRTAVYPPLKQLIAKGFISPLKSKGKRILYRAIEPKFLEHIFDRKRLDLNSAKKELLRLTNKRNLSGNLALAMTGADVFIGVSGPALVTQSIVRSMAKNAIVFALANPVPEIMPPEALAGGARVVATGRSDFPNQLNNSQVFPGVFRGALDHRVREITEEMKRRAAYAIAALVSHPTTKKLVPGMFDKRLVPAVARTIC